MKGYSEKWSRSIHTVRKMIRIKQNRDVFKFYISDMDYYFWRHELLKISGKVDTEVPKLFELKDKKIYEGKGPKPKAKPKKKKKVDKVEGSLDFDESNILAGKRKRKKKVNYAQYF